MTLWCWPCTQDREIIWHRANHPCNCSGFRNIQGNNGYFPCLRRTEMMAMALSSYNSSRTVEWREIHTAMDSQYCLRRQVLNMLWMVMTLVTWTWCTISQVHSSKFIPIEIGIPSWIPNLGWNSKLIKDLNWNSKLNSWSVGRVYNQILTTYVS